MPGTEWKQSWNPPPPHDKWCAWLLFFLSAVKVTWRNATCSFCLVGCGFFFFLGRWVGWSRIFSDIGNFWLILWVSINSHVQFWSFWGFVLFLVGFFCDNTSHVIWLKFLKWVNLGNMSTFTSSCCPKWQLKQRDCYRDEVIKKEKKKKRCYYI